MTTFELEIFKEREPKKTASAYLMADGKLYLNKEAMNMLINGRQNGAKLLVNIAYNKNDDQDKNIYLLLSEAGDKNAKSINKAGYLSSQNFIKSLGIDAKIDSTQYLVEEKDYNGKKMFILKINGKRQRRTRKK